MVPPVQPADKGTAVKVIRRRPGSIQIGAPGAEGNAPLPSIRLMRMGEVFIVATWKRRPVTSLQVGPQVWQPVSTVAVKASTSVSLLRMLCSFAWPHGKVGRPPGRWYPPPAGGQWIVARVGHALAAAALRRPPAAHAGSRPQLPSAAGSGSARSASAAR